MEKEQNAPQIQDLRQQIDYLEEQIRAAEQAANAQLEAAGPLKTVYKWKAPDRIYSPKGKQWYTTVALISVIIVAYAALTANYFLILTIIMLLMLLYALNNFPPNIVEHEITNKGINVFEKFYTWNNLLNFWVTRRAGQYVINIVLVEGNVNRIILLVGKGDAKRIVGELVKYVDYLNPGATTQDFITRFTEGQHIPLTRFLDLYEESKRLNLDEALEKTDIRTANQKSN